MIIPGYISVIVLTRDVLSDHARTCFEALRSSTADHELIVVSRNRDWQTGTVLRQGFDAAVGEYICVVCDDCFVHPEALGLLRDGLLDRSVGAVGGMLYHANGKISHAGAGLTRNTDGLLVFAHQLRHDPESLHYITGALIMTRRDVLDRVGYWDEVFKLAYGDTDFCFRVTDAGYKLKITEAKAIHLEATTRKALGLEDDYAGQVTFLNRYKDRIRVREYA